MKLAEFLSQGKYLRRQSRSSAIAYFEKCLHELEFDEANIDDPLLKARILLDLAAELITTRQSAALIRANSLLQKVADLFDRANLDIPNEQRAYLIYVQGMLVLESGDVSSVLGLLRSAHEAYGDNLEGQSLVNDAIGQYYLRINDTSSALESFEKSLTVRLDSGQDCDIGISYAHLGQLYLLSGDLSQASGLFDNTLDMAIVNANNFLRSQALKGLAKVAIAESEWQSAIDIIKDAISCLQEPEDCIDIGYLYCDLAEALLGKQKIEESIICLSKEALPRFTHLQYERGIAIARYLLAKVQVQQLIDGTDHNIEAIEATEDAVLEASSALENLGMAFDYAKALYNLACLYHYLCSNVQRQYEYKGKALRSLELCLDMLNHLEMGHTEFATQVDTMLDIVMRSQKS
jgi:tetratricopeptide (TPR) repeat protein